MLTPDSYFNIHGLYDLEKLKQHAEHNLVDVITSKEFPHLVMLHYADDAQWDKSWNTFNRMCRGLIVDLKNQRVIAYPFDKFFNVGEMPETSFDRLSSLGAFEVSEKLDGSMLILFQEPETGDFRFTTKGSFDADHAAFANQFMPQSLMNPKLVEDYTFVFELVSKQFQIVVDYKRKGYPDGAYLIGIRHRKSNRLLSYKEVQDMAKEYNIPTLKTFEFPTLESILNNVKTLSVLDEGYVLLFEDGTRAKVKGTEYLRVHRFISQMSDKHLLESMPDFDTIEKEQEFLQMVPEEYRDDIKAKFVEFKTKKIFLTNEIYTKFNEAPKEIRKEFAMWVQQNVDPSLRGFMFTLLDGRQLEASKLYKLIGEKEKVSAETKI